MIREKSDSYVGTWHDGRIRKQSLHKERDLKIFIGGDLCPIGRTETLLIEDAGKEVLYNVRRLTDDHSISIVNLECPLTDHNKPIPKTGPHLRARTACAKGIKGIGFDVVTLANNHMMDMGEAGLRDTLKACRGAGLMTTGAGLSWEEIIEPLIVERNGLKIAVVAFTENEFSTATPAKGVGCNPLDLIGNIKQIQIARGKADFVIVIYHGGSEMYPLPSPRFARTCRFFIEMGADAVVCHHTHVTSGIEYYNQRPIIYGLGNFLFDWPTSQPDDWYQGMAVALIIKKHAPITINIFAFEQCKEQSGVLFVDPEKMELFRYRIERLSEIIAKGDMLEAEWKAFCQRRELRFIIESFGLNRIEAFLYRKGFTPFWRINQKRWLSLLNFIRCESHRDVLINTLSQKRFSD